MGADGADGATTRSAAFRGLCHRSGHRIRVRKMSDRVKRKACNDRQ